MFSDELKDIFSKPISKRNYNSSERYKQRKQKQEAKLIRISQKLAHKIWKKVKAKVRKDFPRYDEKSHKILPLEFLVVFKTKRTGTYTSKRVFYYVSKVKKQLILDYTRTIQNDFFFQKFFMELVKADGLNIEKSFQYDIIMNQYERAGVSNDIYTITFALHH